MFNFRSEITRKILSYYFLNKDKKHYINELANLLDIDPGNLFRKLKELENEGIFISEQSGNQKYFSLNIGYPLLKEIKNTFNAKYGLTIRLKEKLASLPGLENAYIFGSYAKDSLKIDSDIDLLLIGSHSALEAKRIIYPLEKLLGRKINIVDLTAEELERRQKQKDEFIINIFSEKIIKII